MMYLAKYPPSERRAIQVHRFYLSAEMKRQASVGETLCSWESGVGCKWRRDKMRRDHEQQIKEIERHKYFLSERCGYDIGWEAAATDWITNYAGSWREWWEEQAEAGA
jgi:hypothetical protein